jgi:hypothetical protein
MLSTLTSWLVLTLSWIAFTAAARLAAPGITRCAGTFLLHRVSFVDV